MDFLFSIAFIIGTLIFAMKSSKKSARATAKGQQQARHKSSKRLNRMRRALFDKVDGSSESLADYDAEPIRSEDRGFSGFIKKSGFGSLPESVAGDTSSSKDFGNTGENPQALDIPIEIDSLGDVRELIESFGQSTPAKQKLDGLIDSAAIGTVAGAAVGATWDADQSPAEDDKQPWIDSGSTPSFEESQESPAVVAEDPSLAFTLPDPAPSELEQEAVADRSPADSDFKAITPEYEAPPTAEEPAAAYAELNAEVGGLAKTQPAVETKDFESTSSTGFAYSNPFYDRVEAAQSSESANALLQEGVEDFEPAPANPEPAQAAVTEPKGEQHGEFPGGEVVHDPGPLVAELFRPGMMATQARERFASEYAGQHVRWTGEVERVESYFSDDHLGPGAGVRLTAKVEREIGQSSREVRIACALPEGFDKQAELARGSTVTIEGKLRECNPYMLTIYLRGCSIHL
ncbi:MAG: hypothetical protein ACI841_000131 [Planctomycetota bacterium]|jgi:hypothetical protein